MKKSLLAIIILSLIAGCSGVKNLEKPNLDIPHNLASMAGEADTAEVSRQSLADAAWFEFYSSPRLREIITRTLENNRDLLASKAKVEELRQLYGVEKLNYMPVITGLVGGTHETNDYFGEKYTYDPEISVKATLNWEADLWGTLSQSRKKSAATFMASVNDTRAMQITLIAEAATIYYNLVALENELNIVRQTLVTRREALEKSRLRYEGGLTSEIVYQQAKVELATAEALVPGLERRIAASKNALTLLMGELPQNDFRLASTSLPSDSVPVELPLGLSSELLERRPDIRASEYRLKAALASCSMAYKSQFPHLRIALTGGWENDQVANLFKSPFSYVLGNITGTIFDFGRNRRKYRASIAAYDQARYAYEKSVMAAFTEVSNAATACRQARVTAEKRAELREAALKYVNLANKQYIGGTINYIEVLDAQRRYFDAQINLSNAIRDQYLALVSLYKALGGGWENPE